MGSPSVSPSPGKQVTAGVSWFELFAGGLDQKEAVHASRLASLDRNGTQPRFRRRGKDPTREGLICGIESTHDPDLEVGPQLKLNYSSKDHKGFDHILPTVVRGGRAVPITDWSAAAPK